MALRAVGVASRADLVHVVTIPATKISLERVVFPTKPHQPHLSIFPRGHLGSGKEFSAKLVCKMAFLFLHYDESKD